MSITYPLTFSEGDIYEDFVYLDGEWTHLDEFKSMNYDDLHDLLNYYSPEQPIYQFIAHLCTDLIK